MTINPIKLAFLGRCLVLTTVIPHITVCDLTLSNYKAVLLCLQFDLQYTDSTKQATVSMLAETIASLWWFSETSHEILWWDWSLSLAKSKHIDCNYPVLNCIATGGRSALSIDWLTYILVGISSVVFSKLRISTPSRSDSFVHGLQGYGGRTRWAGRGGAGNFNSSLWFAFP